MEEPRKADDTAVDHEVDVTIAAEPYTPDLDPSDVDQAHVDQDLGGYKDGPQGP